MIQKVLIIEDDPLYQTLFSTILDSYVLCVLGDGSSALEYAETWKPDLLVLNIGSDNASGYDLCRQFKLSPIGQRVPVLLLYDGTGLEGRLKAFATGAEEYLNKPFDLLQFRKQVDGLLARKRASDELSQSYGKVMALQTDLARIQMIGRFMQEIFFCYDRNCLFSKFFSVIHELGISGVLRLELEGQVTIRADHGAVQRLEVEVLERGSHLERIRPFGQDRALFSWPQVRFLARHVRGQTDSLTILMDGLQRGIEAIDSEMKLLNKIDRLSHDNDVLKQDLQAIFGTMTTDLREIFQSFNLINDLNDEEEQAVQLFIQDYADRFGQRMGQLSENTQRIIDLVNNLREAPKQEGKARGKTEARVEFF